MKAKKTNKPFANLDPIKTVYFLFLFSGATGLIFEISWARQFGVLLGNTVQSGSIVIASYFLGMAIGYFLSGRLKTKAPLALYGICELVTGGWALLIPILIARIPVGALAGLLSHESLGVSTCARILFSMFVMLPATIPMGATLPYIAAALSKRSSQSSKVLTLAYTANLVGALLGSTVATCFLLVSAGVVGTSYVASVLAIACGIIALVVNRQFGSQFWPEQPPASAKVYKVANEWLAFAAISGFCSIALQVLYIRMFSLVLHNSVYTFAAVVFVFILSLSLGGAIVSKYSKKFSDSGSLINLLQILGIAISSSMLLFLAQTNLDYFQAGQSFYGYLFGAVLLIGAVLIVPVTLSGMILPLTWHWAGAAGTLSTRSIGILTGINTLASTFGSLTAAYVLLPTVGLWGGIAAIATFYILSSFVLMRNRLALNHVVFAALALTVTGTAYHMTGRFDGTADNEKVIKRWESAYGWIDVVRFEKSGHMQLRQNVHYGLGSTGSLAMQRRQANIPLLLHPQPKDVLFVGLATGTTAGAALDHPTVDSISIVELVPDVAKGARLFDQFSGNILDNPKVKLTINDGRHFLASKAEPRFDVIIADLFVPWESHTGYLYTQEHYAVTMRRLREDGLFCQWLPLWQVGVTELNTIANTFASVFPHTTLWYGKLHENYTIVGLVGSKSKLAIDLAQLEARFALHPASKAPDESWFNTQEDFLLYYGGDWRRDPGDPLNTDEHPRIEFLAPISAWTKGARLRFDALRDLHGGVLRNLSRENTVFSRGAESLQIDFNKIHQSQQTMLQDK